MSSDSENGAGGVGHSAGLQQATKHLGEPEVVHQFAERLEFSQRPVRSWDELAQHVLIQVSRAVRAFYESGWPEAIRNAIRTSRRRLAMQRRWDNSAGPCL